MGRRHASLGTLPRTPRTLTVAPGPKPCSDLASSEAKGQGRSVAGLNRLRSKPTRALDGSWASSLPHAASATAQANKRLAPATVPSLLLFRLASDPLSPSREHLQIRPRSSPFLQDLANGVREDEAGRAGRKLFPLSCADPHHVLHHRGEAPCRCASVDGERPQRVERDHAPSWLRRAKDLGGDFLSLLPP